MVATIMIGAMNMINKTEDMETEVVTEIIIQEVINMMMNVITEEIEIMSRGDPNIMIADGTTAIQLDQRISTTISTGADFGT